MVRARSLLVRDVGNSGLLNSARGIALTLLLATLCACAWTDPAEPSPYRLFSGQYQMRLQIRRVGDDENALQRLLPIHLQHGNGHVRISEANDPAAVVDGRLAGTEFAGRLEQQGFHLELSGQLVADDRIEGEVHASSDDAAVTGTFQIARADVMRRLTAVTLFHCFEVPSDQGPDFVARWRDIRAYLETQSGYLASSLHRSLSTETRYSYIAVIRWRSATAFKAAIDTDRFRQLSAGMRYASEAGLFETLFEPE